MKFRSCKTVFTTKVLKIPKNNSVHHWKGLPDSRIVLLLALLKLLRDSRDCWNQYPRKMIKEHQLRHKSFSQFLLGCNPGHLQRRAEVEREKVGWAWQLQPILDGEGCSRQEYSQRSAKKQADPVLAAHTRCVSQVTASHTILVVAFDPFRWSSYSFNLRNDLTPI